MQEIPAPTVHLNDPFWSARLAVNATHAIFHQWDELEKSGCIDNFRIAAGEIEGFREGWFFADSDAYKWLDAAARLSADHNDMRLLTLMENLIALISRAQMPDGYIFTYNQLHFPGQRWVDLQIEHELYCHGHLIEAGVSHFEATGKRDLLDLVIKSADLLVRDFMNTSDDKTCGHEEIELALIRLYRVTANNDYLELASRFLERRGRDRFFALRIKREHDHSEQRKKQVREMRAAYAAQHPAYAISKLPPDNPAKSPRFIKRRWQINALSGLYSQQHAPIRQQTVPVGHAVRWGYLETAIAMLYRARRDDSLLPALKAAWEHMVTRRMYITGGLGALPALEGFGRDYELDDEYAYTETCAALASLFWNWEMALITREAQYSDLFEWQLYNAASVGMGAEGDTYLYNNPLRVRGGLTRLPWYSVPCCPSNLSRTWASLGKNIYSTDGNDIWIHQYFGNETTLDKSTPLHILTESELPFNGHVTIKLDPSSAGEFTLYLRQPSWGRMTITLNGALPYSVTPTRPIFDATASSYDPRLSQFIPIHRHWTSGDVLEINIEMKIEFRCAHPKVKNHAGKVAVTRGPLVYCLESVDNPDVDIFSAKVDTKSLKPEFLPDLFGGTMILCGQTRDGKPLTFIPYQLWGNRGASQMTVWVNT